MRKRFFSGINVISYCRKYDIPLWQCPSFLFMVMGLINVVSCLFFYILGERYIQEPKIVALITLGIASVLLAIAYAITRSLDRLADLNKTKDEFIKIVTHQLRAPLTNIRWAAEFLAGREKGREKLQEKKEGYCDIIKENSQRLENLLTDLLVVSRIKEKGFPRIRERFDLIELIKGVVQDYQFFAKASNINIALELPSKPLYIELNKTLLKTVIENLLNNAIIYNKRGGKAEIKLTKEPKKVLVAVKDTGIGIAAQDRKYIFDKFYRGKNAFQICAQGTGLGLYIVKTILGMMGGRIWFKTKEGQGTTFYFTLPIK